MTRKKKEAKSIKSRPSLRGVLETSTCPACGHHVAVTFYDGGRQPLATLGWPSTEIIARSMPRYDLCFVRCVDCGHIYNSHFNQNDVPYSDNPNLMFNQGGVWKRHLALVNQLILHHLPESPTVVEIGCGDGSFLAELARAKPKGRYFGFDPHSTRRQDDSLIQMEHRLFAPEKDLARLRPDIIISRHVLEHLMNPLGFVQELSFAANWYDIDTRLFIEVPCVDRVLNTSRTTDFYYEHNPHFTTESLKRMLGRCAAVVEVVERSFNDEVVYALARFTKKEHQAGLALEALDFNSASSVAKKSVQRDLQALISAGKAIAIWGGTGKAAALINQYGLGLPQFPIVVDSDPSKVGTHVPGTGQKIRFRDELLDRPVDIILIATQWRAPDIAEEIKRCGISCERILVEHQGRLIDYSHEGNPYRVA